MINKIKDRLFAFPFFPFLFGLYPLLYLWNANRAQQPAYVIIPALIVTVISLLVIYLIALALMRSAHRAALISTLLSFFILAFGQFFNLAKRVLPGLQPRAALLVSSLLLVGLLVLFVIRRWGSPTLTKVLNPIAALLVIFQLATAVPYYLMVSRLQNDQPVEAQQPNTGAAELLIPATGGGSQRSFAAGRSAPQPQRDVYFILLDNYGREDVLKEGANYDNSALIEALKKRGFVFPDCVQGNYSSTAPAIASILNMNYLDRLGIDDSAYSERGHYDKMAPLILDSQVIEKFRGYNYHVVTFRGFMGLIDIQNTDTYISYEQNMDTSQRLETIRFNNLYLGTTILDTANSAFKIYPDWVMSKGPDWMKKIAPSPQVLEPQFEQVYRQNIYAYDALEKIPSAIQSPKFVYAHMYAAHWPFMMRPDGSLRLPFTQELTVEGYVDGVEYTNRRILTAIDSILKNSSVEPVIILQGDHSDEWVRPVEWSGIDRMKILSAYYLPAGGEKLLRETISPVNNFRLVFKHYFGENLNLLPDVSNYLDPRTKTIKKAPKSCISD